MKRYEVNTHDCNGEKIKLEIKAKNMKEAIWKIKYDIGTYHGTTTIQRIYYKGYKGAIHRVY